MCTLPMWKIKFEDGVIIDAHPEEIIPSEMRANGCRWFGEPRPAVESLIRGAANKIDHQTRNNSPHKQSELEH